MRAFRCANENQRWTRDVERLLTDEIAEIVSTDNTPGGLTVLVATHLTQIIGVIVASPADGEYRLTVARLR